MTRRTVPVGRRSRWPRSTRDTVDCETRAATARSCCLHPLRWRPARSAAPSRWSSTAHRMTSQMLSSPYARVMRRIPSLRCRQGRV
jgi:hypothetical protein